MAQDASEPLPLEKPEQPLTESKANSPWIDELRDDSRPSALATPDKSTTVAVPELELSGFDNDIPEKQSELEIPSIKGSYELESSTTEENARYEQRRNSAHWMALDYGFLPQSYKRIDQSPAADESTPSGNPFSSTESVDEIAKNSRMDSETVKSIRDELATYGKTPESLLPNLMKHNRVLALGEGHSHDEPQEKMLTKLMGNLKESGATHLAVEIQDQHQAALDEFIRTGEFPDSLPSHILNNPVYMETLKAARDAGMKIVAVDMPHAPNEERPERDPYMAHKIDEVLSQSPDNKVVFLVGERHTDDFSQRPNDNPDRQGRAVEFLRDKYDVASVGFVDTDKELAGIGKAVSDIKTPVAVSTSQAETIGSHKQYPSSFPHSMRDFVIFYP